MIPDVDESIRNLIRRDVVPGGGVEVVLDAPTREWAARRNAPTIDVYLYDLREDVRRRQAGQVDVVAVRDGDGDGGPARTVARRPPPRFFKLSYLLTAWTPRPEDEHRLLSALLTCFLRHDHLPADVLAGDLAGRDVLLPLTLAVPPSEDRALSDVWSALGGELKPSLDLVLTAPVDLDRREGTAPPVLHPPRVELHPPRDELHPPRDEPGRPTRRMRRA